ncbi:MAG: alpha/beta hydrolase [Novosphingobium sp.]
MTTAARLILTHLVVAAALTSASASQAQDPPLGLEVLPAPAQPNTVSLATDNAPDREMWGLDDGKLSVRNVTRPTLTAFRPVGRASRAAVIIAPGGGFLGLAMEKEGWSVARQLANNGITAFVLKYRLLPTPVDQKTFVTELTKMIHGEKATFGMPDDTPAEALADGIASLRYVRAHAPEFGLDPKKIGFLGFSAGGFLARTLIERGGADRPDFAAPIYPNMAGIAVPDNAPPIFIAVAADDFLLARVKGMPLVESYRTAGKSVELHLFAAGGHGFAGGKPGTPEEGWLDLMMRWMRTIGMLEK